MAISKAAVVTQSFNSSVSGNYWVTEVVAQSPDNSATRAMIHLFESQASFVAGERALYTAEYLLTDAQNPLKEADLVALVEAKLVTIPGVVSGGSVV